MKMKIISLNCFGAPQSFNRKYRFRKISDELIALNPHVVALQEVYFNSDREELLKYLNDTFETQYSKRSLNTTLGGLITLVREIKNEYAGFTKFSDQGPIALLPLFDRLAPKGFQHIKLFRKREVVDVINVHTICVYKQTPKYLKTYSNQVNELIKYIKLNCGNHIVIAGDLNGDTNSEEIVVLKDELSLHETLEANTVTVSSRNTNRKGLTNAYSNYKSFRTDYILSTPNINLLSTKVIFDEPYILDHQKSAHLSDHFGIISEIDI